MKYYLLRTLLLLCARLLVADAAGCYTRRKLRQRDLQGVCDNCNPRAECIELVDVTGFKCMCKDGYDGDGVFVCNDRDECAADSPCEEEENGGYCVDNDPPQKYTCGCHEGYNANETLRDPKHGPLGCIEADECLDGTHNCHPYFGVCTNTPGSFTCACADGYSGDGVESCQLIPEESADEDGPCNPNPCNPVHQACFEDSTKLAGYNCTCTDGFFNPAGHGAACEDWNECENNAHNCDANARCINLEGSYRCECNIGYRGSGYFCDDYDECAANTTICSSDITTTCLNRPGTYECIVPTPAPTPQPTPQPTRKPRPVPAPTCPEPQ